jgi:cyclophilin family peptidyl-prolyl cis-trans isomerase
VARIETVRGVFRIALDAELAPVTVANFIALADSGALARTGFHRVVPDFVVQGGDPRGDGSGGPGYTVPCENSDASFETGVVGMALAGKDTGGSQFFVTHAPQPHLDGRYTVFGRVIEGQGVVDAIVEFDHIRSIRIER